jgi:hypothetical protein
VLIPVVLWVTQGERLHLNQAYCEPYARLRCDHEDARWCSHRCRRPHRLSFHGRIILLAPPDQQRDICVFVAGEINEMLEQVLHLNNATAH